MIEIICAVLGLVQGVLAWLDKRVNWLVYALMMIFLIIFSADNRLWGDVFQNAIYFVICVYSYFFLWNKDSEYKDITKLTKEGIICTIISIVGMTALVGVILNVLNDPLPMIDAFTTVTTFAALIMMSRHKLECWVVWLVNDIAYILQYYMLPDQAWYLIILYVIWTGFAIGSFVNWKRIYDSKNKKN